ncbi:MAG: 50S ribosomal protein L18e [Candidatus Nanoarchaeia archaeon]
MKTNPQLKDLVGELKKEASEKSVKLWNRLATDLEKPTRQRKAINLNKINLLTKENEIIVVPGKVLSNGELQHKVTIAALNFSRQATEKIKNSNSQMYTIRELIKNNPEGKNVRILI